MDETSKQRGLSKVSSKENHHEDSPKKDKRRTASPISEISPVSPRYSDTRDTTKLKKKDINESRNGHLIEPKRKERPLSNETRGRHTAALSIDSSDETDGISNTLKENKDSNPFQKQKKTAGISNPYEKKRIIGNYELLDSIGEGAFAKVKLGVHLPTGQKVAIKILDKAKIQADQYSSKNYKREAQVLRKLDHPNIVKLFEVMETDRFVFLILEYASKGELLEYIVKNGKLDETEAKRIMKQVLSAMEYCHNNMVVHRDLKAENILLDENMNIKITDFGLATNYGPKATLETCCGSPVYSAPELIEGRKYHGPEVDIWSMGVNMYAMVVGDLPFADSNLTKLYESITQGNYIIPDSLSHNCRDFISKMLQVQPIKRMNCTKLKEHLWLQDTTTFIGEITEEDAYISFRPQDEKAMDNQILAIIEKCYGDRQKVKTSVLQGKFNQLAGLYYLLAYKKLKGYTIEILNDSPSTKSEHKQGGEEISDVLAQVLFKFEKAVQMPQEKVNNKKRLEDKALVLPQIMPSGDNSKGLHKKIAKQPGILPMLPPKEHSSEALKHGVMQDKGLPFTLFIDETLYISEEDAPPNTRTIKYPGNCVMKCSMPPNILFDKLLKVLEDNDIQWVNQEYLCECYWGDLKFEAEVCKLPRMDNYGVRLKRITGDIWEFKKLNSKLAQELLE